MPFDQEFYVASPRSEPDVSADEMLAVLVKAREWLSDPERWTQGCAFRDIDGEECSTGGQRVASACAIGSVMRLVGSGRAIAFIDPLGAQVPDDFEVTAGPISKISVAQFNDASTTTHADILALFDRAIAARTAELTRLG